MSHVAPSAACGDRPRPSSCSGCALTQRPWQGSGTLASGEQEQLCTATAGLGGHEPAEHMLSHPCGRHKSLPLILTAMRARGCPRCRTAGRQCSERRDRKWGLDTRGPPHPVPRPSLMTPWICEANGTSLCQHLRRGRWEGWGPILGAVLGPLWRAASASPALCRRSASCGTGSLSSMRVRMEEAVLTAHLPACMMGRIDTRLPCPLYTLTPAALLWS